MRAQQRPPPAERTRTEQRHAAPALRYGRTHALRDAQPIKFATRVEGGNTKHARGVVGADEPDPLERTPCLLGRGADLEGELHGDLRYREACHGVSLHLGTAHVEERDAGYALEAAAAEHKGRGLRVEAEQVR